MKKNIAFGFLLLVLFAAACAPAASPPQPAQSIDEVVQQTFVALTVQAALAATQVPPTATPLPPTPTFSAPVEAPPSPTLDGPKPLKPEGGITGSLSYPSEGRPDIMVVAFSTQYYPNGNYYFVFTTPSQATYEMVLPQGEYYIVAYALDPFGNPMGLAGGYTQAVPCGLNVACTDHSLIPVPVAAGGAMGEINPADWYAPEGSFPPYPLK
ncbi:MAG: hypothetical protein ACOY0R_06180 [Chloroflexota bacterium]